ncbi:MAG TPA: YceD family protein [Methylibium sp.]|uniref:YceD family protein n=1 Tax=Methylibium sp. TaxID=2067992 RepID=UPI002DBC2040|nr:YceD family protein [Methylibium sp.]HEU4458672.1 YceD family protein [Methylibium sp.]
MTHKSFDPRRLDVERLARQGASIEGRWPLAGLARLSESVVPDASAPELGWSARGELVSRPGQPDEIWLALRAQGEMALVCQRCLQPLRQPLAVDRRIRFVRGEDQAARLDGELEDDVLALGRSLDLCELVEDELLLALPLVPRHDICPAGAVAAATPTDEPASEPSPFAVLQTLLGDKPRG